VLGVIIVGLLAGWIAGKLIRGQGYGIVADIALGLVGAVIGQWLFGHLGIPVYSRLSFLAMATVGAVILVGAAHFLSGASSRA
jgi:uncharacterized membrane protein YeaQ/YmgE (transglycosylase-associated protein family)